MRKLLATLLTFAMIFTVMTSVALAEATEAPVSWTFSGGIAFNMDMDQVIGLLNLQNYEIDREKARGGIEFYVLEFEKVTSEAEGLTADIDYLFVGNSLVAIHYDFADGTDYDAVKAKLVEMYGNAVPFDAAKIDAGRYAIDEAGDLKDCVEMIEAANDLIVVLERDKDGDVEVTFLDMSAAYIRS